MDFSPPAAYRTDKLPFDIKRLHARELCCHAQLFLNAEQLVVLRNTLTSARCAGLDLAGVQRNCKICDGGILGLAGAVGRDGGVACLVGHLDGFQSLGYGTDLV